MAPNGPPADVPSPIAVEKSNGRWAVQMRKRADLEANVYTEIDVDDVAQGATAKVRPEADGSSLVVESVEIPDAMGRSQSEAENLAQSVTREVER